jgi:hypothetical protein
VSRYQNGRVPLDVLEHLGGDIYLPPATAARWRGFRDDVKAETGVTLYITPATSRGWDGWNGYRPLGSQITYKAHLGMQAAMPGTSSHGGVYQGSDCFAMDIGNYWAVPWEVFTRLARKWGLTTNFVTPEERWHVGDKNPWTMPDGSGGSTTPTIKEDDEMYSVLINGKQYGLAKQFITHYGTVAQAQVTRSVTSATDELHDLNKSYGKEANGYWGELLDGLGIPRTVLDAQGLVKNPQANGGKGAFEANGTWSREREILAALKVV